MIDFTSPLPDDEKDLALVSYKMARDAANEGNLEEAMRCLTLALKTESPYHSAIQFQTMNQPWHFPGKSREEIAKAFSDFQS